MKEIAIILDAKEEGREEEHVNTERERQRADKAEARVKELETLLAKTGQWHTINCISVVRQVAKGEQKTGTSIYFPTNKIFHKFQGCSGRKVDSVVYMR